MKRLLQSFLYAVGVAEKSGKEFSASLIAKTIIIQYGHKNFYKSILENPSLMPALEQYFRWKVNAKPIDSKAEDDWIEKTIFDVETRNRLREYRDSFTLRNLLGIQLEDGDSFTNENIGFYLYYIKPVSPIIDNDDKSIFEQELEKEQSLDQKVETVIGLPAGSYIPFPRNALFTGRESDLKTLAGILCEPGTSSGAIISQALTGMGGIGKTQLAVEFAYRYGHLFAGVH